MLQIVAIKKSENGSHENQTWFDGVPVPEGYALVPEELNCENFPFGDIVVEEIEGTKTVAVWTPLPFPEPSPAIAPEPTQLDVLQAQVTYTAMKTGTLIGGTK